MYDTKTKRFDAANCSDYLASKQISKQFFLKGTAVTLFSLLVRLELGKESWFTVNGAVFLTYYQINLRVIPPHVFFKQVDHDFQSGRILQNGTDISAGHKHHHFK